MVLQTKLVNRIPSLPDILCDYPIYGFKQYALEKVFIENGRCARDCISVKWGMKRFILV